MSGVRDPEQIQVFHAKGRKNCSKGGRGEGVWKKKTRQKT